MKTNIHIRQNTPNWLGLILALVLAFKESKEKAEKAQARKAK